MVEAYWRIFLAELPDPRARHGVRYQFTHPVLIMLCSVLAGAKTLVEMAEWAADTAWTELTACGIGAPHATTLARVFERLDSDAFDMLVSDWAEGLSLLAAINQNSHVVLAQVALGEKGNEIPQFPVLMDHFGPSQMSWSQRTRCTRRQATRTIWRARSALHLHGERKPPTLLKQLSQTPWEQVPTADRSSAKANGRQIIRTVKCATGRPGIKFPYALQAMQITRKSRPLGTEKWHLETVYAVTSLPT